VVGIFVEGARQRSDEVGEAMPGAALLALRAGVPVVPCGLDTFGWSRREGRPCVVVFGDPLRLDGLPVGREGVELGTRHIAAALEEARRKAVEANAAGRPSALPDGARRARWRDVWLQALTHRASA
jgi:1-acyl-sn-glycerol-3-phosphate acyltransferase